MSGLVVTKADVIAAGFCGAGLKRWAELNGFSARDLKQGVPVERVEAVDCALARKVVAAARRRAEISEVNR